MTDHQFIQASKEFFFQYFVDELLGKKPSLLSMVELLEDYKKIITNDNEIKNKTGSGNAFSDSQELDKDILMRFYLNLGTANFIDYSHEDY